MAGAARPWWLVDPGRDVAGEMLGLRLLGLADRRLDRALSAVLLALLIASRLAALPAGPWDQDEAYLALGVLAFDPGHLAPHPPWFPLWILVGTLLRLVVGDPFRALTVAGAVAGGLLVWPVAALWARVLERRLALLSALLVAAAPGPWLLAARGTTEAPAMTLLAAAAALWLGPSSARRSVVNGSLLLGLALLVRPQLLPAAVPLALWRASRSQARAVLLPACAALALGGLLLVVATGGPGVLLAAAREHLSLHLGGLAHNRYGFADWCVPRALGSGLAGTVFGVLATVGVVALWRRRRSHPAVPVIVLALLTPLTLTASLLQNGTLARYATPLLALAAGLAASGAAVVVGRRAPGVLAAAAVVLAVQTAAALAAARARPPVAEAFSLAEATSAVVVADDRLHAFVELARRTGGPGAAAVLATPAALGVLPVDAPVAHVVELGDAEPPTGAEVVRAVDPLLERLAAGRFVRLAVMPAER